MDFLNKMQDLLDSTRKVDFLGPLALRLYLVPVFWVAGTNKIDGFENVVQWFGNPDWGLGLPAPALMAFLAVGAEVVGAIALLLGLATRWMCIPLMITMLVAAFSVHWKNGWQAVADKSSPFAGDDNKVQVIFRHQFGKRHTGPLLIIIHATTFRSDKDVPLLISCYAKHNVIGQSVQAGKIGKRKLR